MCDIDDRVKAWLLVYSPWPTISLCLAYVTMCYLGPMVMNNRPAFDLKPLLVIYNFTMVVVSGYVCVEVCIYTKNV